MATDRGRAALHKLVLLLIPELAGYVQWTYQVLAVYPGPPVTLDLKAMAPSNPFGTTLAGVTMWPGPDGGVCIPTVGKLVMVRFNDTLTPAVCGIDPTDTPAIVYQYGAQIQIGDATAAPLMPAAWATAAIGTLVGSLSSAPSGPVTGSQLNAMGAAISAAILGLPNTTVKALGT
jgi:hypothetical protein